MSKYVSTDDGFKLSPYLRILNEALKIDETNHVEKFRGIYGLKVKRSDGVEGFWVINLKEGKGQVEFNSSTKPDVTFIINDEDVIKLLTGEIPSQKAFFMGLVKIQGNVGLAMKLTQIQSVIKSELDKFRSKL
nr:non-specific lipid-transfer protein-like [Onthophagus taurus]